MNWKDLAGATRFRPVFLAPFRFLFRFPLRYIFVLIVTLAVAVLAQASEEKTIGWEDLRRWHQWGLYDSIGVHWNQVLTSSSLDTASKAAAEPFLLRASSLFSRGKALEAKADFLKAACLDSTVALDSFYVSSAMWRLHREAHRSALLDSCPQLIGNQPLPHPSPEFDSTANPVGSDGSLGVNRAETGNKPNLDSPPNFLENTWKKPAGWASLGLGTGAGLFSVYALIRENDAYSQLKKVIRSPDDEQYRRLKSERHDWQVLSLSGALVSIAGLGIGAYWLLSTPSEPPQAGWQITPDGRLAYRF